MICWQFPLVGWQERNLMMKVSTMTHCLSIQKMPLNLWKFKHSFPSCYIYRMWLPLQNSKLCVLCKGIGSHCVKEFLAFIQMHLHAYLYVSLFKNLFFFIVPSPLWIPVLDLHFWMLSFYFFPPFNMVVFHHFILVPFCTSLLIWPHLYSDLTFLFIRIYFAIIWCLIIGH